MITRVDRIQSADWSDSLCRHHSIRLISSAGNTVWRCHLKSLTVNGFEITTLWRFRNYLFILFIYLFVHLFIYLFTYLFIYLFIYYVTSRKWSCHGPNCTRSGAQEVGNWHVNWQHSRQCSRHKRKLDGWQVSGSIATTAARRALSSQQYATVP